jgi:hypothetical protein
MLEHKFTGNQGEIILEVELDRRIPYNYDREEAHGEHRPDFVVKNDGGERVAVVDSKNLSPQAVPGKGWTDAQQAEAFLKLAAESEARTLIIATPDGTDRGFSGRIKTLLREQPNLPVDKKVNVIVTTPAEAAKISQALVNQSNERASQAAAQGAATQTIRSEGPAVATAAGSVTGPPATPVMPIHLGVTGDHGGSMA